MDSVFNKKINEEEMLGMLGQLLLPGESITAAVYCVFHDTGFFASNLNTKYGYVGITDANRLIGWQMGILGMSEFTLDLIFLSKIKITNMILGSKIIYMVFQQDQKTEIKFQCGPKIAGNKFPHQKENVQTLFSELQARHAMLKKK